MSGPSNLLHDHPQHSRTGGGNGLRYNHHLRVRSVLDCIVAPDHDVREPRLADVQYSKAAALGAVMIGAHALSSVRMAEKRRGPAERTQVIVDAIRIGSEQNIGVDLIEERIAATEAAGRPLAV
ncbi:hypothetical protein CVN56_27115 [Rhodococcus sp. AQ5-07]|nr:hypothetical protein CVN56_27115 [Rhodococcus sp. AQ5-07]